ncbi:hypothetical protein CEXT_104181 [Caerostris extrusa]|uniref:Uncharacterized protein n=1 Tax=Caerostris extrusa TaxID=172846 RepID=A0AAV4T8E4_CAEEX|nr:hypothetical protein CEXT_104181 [Caerostris extrusa]
MEATQCTLESTNPLSGGKIFVDSKGQWTECLQTNAFDPPGIGVANSSGAPEYQVSRVSWWQASCSGACGGGLETTCKPRSRRMGTVSIGIILHVRLISLHAPGVVPVSNVEGRFTSKVRSTPFK